MRTETFYLITDVLALITLAVLMMEYPTMEQKTEPPKLTLKERIYAMLDFNRAHDYDQIDWSVEEIIADMRAYVDDPPLVESDEELYPHIIMWKATRRTLAS